MKEAATGQCTVLNLQGGLWEGGGEEGQKQNDKRENNLTSDGHPTQATHK
jgi:hypothetical protein